jgi:hypothetical protein
MSGSRHDVTESTRIEVRCFLVDTANAQPHRVIEQTETGDGMAGGCEGTTLFFAQPRGQQTPYIDCTQ